MASWDDLAVCVETEAELILLGVSKVGRGLL